MLSGEKWCNSTGSKSRNVISRFKLPKDRFVKIRILKALPQVLKSSNKYEARYVLRRSIARCHRPSIRLPLTWTPLLILSHKRQCDIHSRAAWMHRHKCWLIEMVRDSLIVLAVKCERLCSHREFNIRWLIRRVSFVVALEKILKKLPSMWSV